MLLLTLAWLEAKENHNTKLSIYCCWNTDAKCGINCKYKWKLNKDKQAQKIEEYGQHIAMVSIIKAANAITGEVY